MTETYSHNATPNSENKIRSTKRKLDDAFQVLDNAVNPTPVEDGPHPPKRTNTIRSLYSTLAKYGIKSGTTPSATTPAVSSIKSTPHLTAILTRAAAKTKNTFTFKFPSQLHTPGPILPATAEYRPSSLPSFLSRLATYKLATYTNKPPAIDAVAASKCGWINDGKDRLVCGLCNASWVVGGREGMNRDAANILIEKQRFSLVEAHKNGCPWKTRQCDDSIYCVPLQSPAALLKDIKTKAIAMDPVIKDISTKHPLTASQLNSFRTTVSSFVHPTLSRMDEEKLETSASTSTSPSEPSETAILASLFGWTLVPPAALEPLRRSSTTTRLNSPSVPPSPSLSRASSVSLPRTPPKVARASAELSLRIASTLPNKPDNTLLQCELCQRRLGLWSYATHQPSSVEDSTPIRVPTPSAGSMDTPSTAASSRPVKALPRRSFDFLKEHRSYCPYVVRSTVMPSLPVPQQTSGRPARSSMGSNGRVSTSSLAQFSGKNAMPGALEGWKAVLMVVLRYGMAQKQRIEYNFLAPKDPTQTGDGASDEMEVDNVKAMVTGVKARGGKDLLKYVKGLLG